MRTPRLKHFRPLLLLVCLSWASGAVAQACEWDGERTICPVNPQSGGGGSLPFGIQPGWLSRLFQSHPKPRDEVFEKYLSDYEFHFQVIFENSRTFDRIPPIKKPKSRDDLSRRIDQVLTAVWPEYMADLQEYNLLRQQSSFYETDNKGRTAGLASDRARLTYLRNEVAQLRVQSSQLERLLAESRARESELSTFALQLLNDRTVENRAVATLLVFTRNPGVSLNDLAPRPPVTVVPGTTTEFYPPGLAIAADSAEPRVPNQYQNIDVPRPPPEASIDQKLNFMQVVGRDLETMWFNTPPLRSRVATQRAENDALKSEDAQVLAELRPVAGEEYSLQAKMVRDQVYLEGSKANSEIDARTIFREVLVDMALDSASDKIKSLVESKLHLEGAASTPIPADGTEALLEAAKHGTRYLLPASYQQQMQTILELQGQTWSVLGRNEGFMLNAARLLAAGNAAEGEAYADKVFATAKWQSFEMVKTIGMGELPEGDEKSVVEGIFERALGKIKQKQTGDE